MTTFLLGSDWEAMQELRRRMKLVAVEMETLKARLEGRHWGFDDDDRISYRSGKRGRPPLFVTDVILKLHTYLRDLLRRLKSRPEPPVDVESDIRKLLLPMVDVTIGQIKDALANHPTKGGR